LDCVREVARARHAALTNTAATIGTLQDGGAQYGDYEFADIVNLTLAGSTSP